MINFHSVTLSLTCKKPCFFLLVIKNILILKITFTLLFLSAGMTSCDLSFTLTNLHYQRPIHTILYNLQYTYNSVLFIAQNYKFAMGFTFICKQHLLFSSHSPSYPLMGKLKGEMCSFKPFYVHTLCLDHFFFLPGVPHI